MGEAKRKASDLEALRAQALFSMTALVLKAGGQVILSDSDFIQAAGHGIEVVSLPDGRTMFQTFQTAVVSAPGEVAGGRVQGRGRPS